MRVSKTASWWLPAWVGLLVAACGGDQTPSPSTPASEPMPPVVESEMADEGAVAQSGATELVREIFSYRGSGRDPFISLLESGAVRPLLADLRVTSINYNLRYPGGSVAVLRDVSENRRYTVRVGDEVGRLRIAEIREREVVVIYEEFGEERQQVLRVRQKQEEIL